MVQKVQHPAVNNTRYCKLGIALSGSDAGPRLGSKGVVTEWHDAFHLVFLGSGLRSFCFFARATPPKQPQGTRESTLGLRSFAHNYACMIAILSYINI